MRRRGTRARFTITAVTLLILVAVFAWTLKHKKNEGEISTPVQQGMELAQTTQPDSEMEAREQQGTTEGGQAQSGADNENTQEGSSAAKDSQEGTSAADGSQDTTEDGETGAAEPVSSTSEDDIAAMRASFMTDYTSAPLLNTTSIKYLTMQQGGQPGEVRFNWFSPSSSKGQVVIYNTGTGESATFQAETAASATEAGFYYHKATVTGLQEETTYSYKVGSKDGWSPEYQFTTQSFSGDFTFLVTSDAQIGQSEMEVVQNTIDRWDKVLTRLNSYVPEAAFLVHLGDQVAGYNDTEQYRGFFEHLALYQTPMVPIVGNHDIDSWDSGGGPWFYERYNVPNRSTIGCNWSDTDGDYWFRYGNTLFMVLNSNTLYGPDVHAEFVEQACGANPDAKWRIILVHQSGYSSVEKYQYEAEMYREHYAYLGETYGIDLFLNGHDHAYTRTALMSGICEPLTQYDYASGSVIQNPEGTMHVICSTASGCTYQPVYENYAAVVQGQPEVPMAIRVDVTDTTLKLTAYLVDSWQVYDEITLQK